MSEARRGRRMPFVILPWAVLEDENLTAYDVLVYATIARYADVNSGEAWPSRQTVAQQARCDIKTVDRAVTRLVAAGFLEKHKRKNQEGETNLYIVHEVVARQEKLEKRRGGRDSNGARVGTQTVRPLATQTVRELEPLELDSADTSEWTEMPDDIRAMLDAHKTKGAA
ncbi:MAG TPA: helix-turn-helix domain-containing protein [Acidimicrobiia bacterium]